MFLSWTWFKLQEVRFSIVLCQKKTMSTDRFAFASRPMCFYCPSVHPRILEPAPVSTGAQSRPVYFYIQEATLRLLRWMWQWESVQLHRCPSCETFEHRHRGGTHPETKAHLWTNMKEKILCVDDNDDKESWEEDVGLLFLPCPSSSLSHTVDVASCRGQPVCSLLT